MLCPNRPQEEEEGRESDNVWADFTGFLCPSHVELAQPRRLLNVERQWRVILNDGQKFQQTVRLETCSKVICRKIKLLKMKNEKKLHGFSFFISIVLTYSKF